MRDSMDWQMEWSGPRLQNTRLLVCCRCLDVPNEQFRTIFIGPDPVPVRDPRPGFIGQQNRAGAAPQWVPGRIGPNVVPD